MSNVQECIDLYLTDEEVSDAQFRAVIVDAYERDSAARDYDRAVFVAADDVTLDQMRELLVNHGKSLVLLNKIDDLRRDHIEDHDQQLRKLTGFCDSLAGQVRVLRERLDNMEGK